MTIAGDPDIFDAVFNGAMHSSPETEPAPAATPEGEPATLAAKLERNSHLALDKGAEILAKALDPQSPHYPAELRARTALINTQVSVQARVDETTMKAKRDDDTLARLLDIVAEEKRNLGYALTEADRARLARLDAAASRDAPLLQLKAESEK